MIQVETGFPQTDRRSYLSNEFDTILDQHIPQHVKPRHFEVLQNYKKFFLEKLKPLIGNESVLRIGKFALVLLSLPDLVTASREHCSFM